MALQALLWPNSSFSKIQDGGGRHLENTQTGVGYISQVLADFYLYSPVLILIPVYQLVNMYGYFKGTDTQTVTTYLRLCVHVCDILFRCTDKKRAIWNVGSISDLSENAKKGCVRAKFDLGSSPSGPHLAALSFTCEGTTFSGVELELLGSGYRTSLVKKRIISGESNNPIEILVNPLKGSGIRWLHFKVFNAIQI